MTKNQTKIFNLVSLALLTAMQVVLARFAVVPISETIRFSASFIPVVIAARRFGILSSVAVYGVGDLLGALLFPVGGAFFPGFTITACISGLIFGICLRKTNEENTVTSKVKMIVSVVMTQLLGSFLLNSLWLSYLKGIPYTAVLLTRVPQCLIIGALQIVFMVLFLDKICSVIKIPNTRKC